jgi:PleD family two-component response regulator
MISAVLQTENVLVSKAATSEQAWEVVSSEKDVNAILMDVRLSGPVSGIDLTRRIHEAFQSIPIIGLTAGKKIFFSFFSFSSSFFLTPLFPQITPRRPRRNVKKLEWRQFWSSPRTKRAYLER